MKKVLTVSKVNGEIVAMKTFLSSEEFNDKLNMFLNLGYVCTVGYNKKVVK